MTKKLLLNRNEIKWLLIVGTLCAIYLLLFPQLCSTVLCESPETGTIGTIVLLLKDFCKFTSLVSFGYLGVMMFINFFKLGSQN
jgi:hypothetical protein